MVFAFGAEMNRAVLTQGDAFHTMLEYTTPERIRKARRGIGLLNMNGSPHREAKRMLTPSFHPSGLGDFVDVMREYTRDELSTWRPGNSIDISQAMRRLTLRIACRSFFGVDIATGAEDLGGMVARMLSLRYFASSIRYFPFDVPGSPYRRLLRTIRELDDALAAVVDRRAAAGDFDRDLLGRLLAGHGRRLDRDQVVGHLTTLIVAGHDTTANTLAWNLLMNATHDHVKNGVWADRDSGHLSPRLDRSLKETLRLLPPGPLTSRIVMQESPLGAHVLAPGTQVVVSKYVTHRDPHVFAHPDTFDPDRWVTARPGLYEYHPYGAGPHVCIGAAFADLEMKVILSEINERFLLTPIAGRRIDRDVGLLMSVRGGLVMNIHDAEARPAPVRIEGNVREMVQLP
jgi:cytochrome P450